MQRRRQRRKLLLSLLPAALAACVLLAPAAAEAKTVWLCKPGLDDNPCTRSLTATVVNRELEPVRVERTRIPKKPPVDCFYVYPTVSGQETVNANRKKDPEIRAIASFQANRFAEHCRVFAPVYRQLTLTGIFNAGENAAEARELAFGDVRAAWRQYLRKHNRGRGVVLLSHSQGTFMLRELIDREIEEKPKQLRRLISAMLTGGNVTVRKGRDVGGDFESAPACRAPTQNRCVIAYSIYNETPPDNTLFGRATDEDLEVLCNNPASLDGGSGTIDGYIRTEPFPGLLGAVIRQQVGELPDLGTPWLSSPGHYTARCVRANGAHVLHVDEVGSARVLNPAPDDSWGLHLGDMSLPMGNLTELVRRQSRAYLR